VSFSPSRGHGASDCLSLLSARSLLRASPGIFLAARAAGGTRAATAARVWSPRTYWAPFALLRRGQCRRRMCRLQRRATPSRGARQRAPYRIWRRGRLQEGRPVGDSGNSGVPSSSLVRERALVRRQNARTHRTPSRQRGSAWARNTSAPHPPPRRRRASTHPTPLVQKKTAFNRPDWAQAARRRGCDGGGGNGAALHAHPHHPHRRREGRPLPSCCTRVVHHLLREGAEFQGRARSLPTATTGCMCVVAATLSALRPYKGQTASGVNGRSLLPPAPRPCGTGAAQYS
jgi:hypothetical protein